MGHAGFIYTKIGCQRRRYYKAVTRPRSRVEISEVGGYRGIVIHKGAKRDSSPIILLTLSRVQHQTRSNCSDSHSGAPLFLGLRRLPVRDPCTGEGVLYGIPLQEPLRLNASSSFWA